MLTYGGSMQDEKQLFDDLIRTIAALGWTIAVPGVGDDDDVPGLIVGKNAYVNAVLDHIPEDFSDRFKAERRSDVQTTRDQGLGAD